VTACAHGFVFDPENGTRCSLCYLDNPAAYPVVDLAHFREAAANWMGRHDVERRDDGIGISRWIAIHAMDRAIAAEAEVDRKATRIQELLALAVKVTNETPYPEELQGWESQRRAMIAEIGTLRGDRCNVCDDDGLIWVSPHGGPNADDEPEPCPECGGTKSGYASRVTEERDEARETSDNLTRQNLALLRELERHRHGATIEGDVVCPDSLALTAAEKRIGELEAGLREAIKDGCALTYGGRPPGWTCLDNQTLARVDLARIASGEPRVPGEMYSTEYGERLASGADLCLPCRLRALLNPTAPKEPT
jgi:hypothetical protein